jgi:chromosome partitioning protein
VSGGRRRRSGPCRLVVAAHKGGVGKTTVAVGLGGAFAEQGRRTLLVDVDPQGGASAALGVRPEAPTLYDVVLGGVGAASAVVPTAVDGLDVLPADLDLAGAELGLPRLGAWQTRLRQVLAAVDEAYDMVVLDSAPGLGVLPFAALVAADHVLITATPAYLTLRAVPHVVDTVDQAQAFQPQLKVLGIVPSIVGSRTLHRDEVLAEFEKRWPGWVLPPVPRRVALEDAAADGQPITLYAPRSSSAAAVRALAEEVIARAAS